MNARQSRIGYLGSKGSYTHQAAEELFKNEKLVGFASIHEIVEATEQGVVDKGVVPVENSIAGRVADLYQILDLINLSIVAEHFVEIAHCLAVPTPSDKDKEIDLKEIENVYSHKQALMQCRDWMSSKLPDAEAVSMSDTASSAKYVSETALETKAAICSKRAADIYNLSVVAEDIQNIKQNYTRFHVLSRQPVQPDNLANLRAITTVIFQVKHTPGSLLKALSAIAENDVNVVKLETYMVSGLREAPTFYVDIAVNRFSELGEKALSELANNTSFLKVIGCYSSSPLRSVVSGFLSV
ncbi:prephenate dehydratase [Litorimonas taeanensis]|uniref:prephenate dehydratase n=1 Tax=Litorimonas taeanensis TaxID=568099 RepID=A0A420WCU0_9PROT|nr:prephenate dehydratase domain-containing protein [Litorimonas taeanensis]RKQ68837.1 prephenate dehydratase [Litorimonas taeanensis]